MRCFLPAFFFPELRDTCRSVTFGTMFGVKLLKERERQRQRYTDRQTGAGRQNVLLKIAIPCGCDGFASPSFVFNTVSTSWPLLDFFFFFWLFSKCSIIQFSLNEAWDLVTLLALRCSLEITCCARACGRIEVITKVSRGH